MVAVLGGLFSWALTGQAGAFDGAIFTSRAGCETVNGNIYATKGDVFVYGGALGARVFDDGLYFLKVTDPSGAVVLGVTPDAVELGATAPGCQNLMAVTVHWVGEHTVPGYADTPNEGGEYKVWASPFADFPDGPDTKTDNFKVGASSTSSSSSSSSTSSTVTILPAADLAGSAAADMAYTNTFPWSVAKSVTTAPGALGTITATGPTTPVGYSVTATKGAAVPSAWTVTGAFTVTNGNAFAVQGVRAGITSTSDPLATCGLTSPSPATVPADDGTADGSHEFEFSCTFSAAPAPRGSVTATISYDADAARSLAANSFPLVADYDFALTAPANITEVDACVAISDSLAGTLSAAPCASGTATYPYSYDVPVTARACTATPNTATALTSVQPQPSDAKSVTVCGPASGGLTMGFWQGPNGQGLIKQAGIGSSQAFNGSVVAYFDSIPALRGLVRKNGVLATRDGFATTVNATVKASNAGNATMASMLRAQMMATALDVYFSGVPGTGGSVLAKHNGGFGAYLGDLRVDLTNVPLPGGGAVDARSAWGPATSKTVSELLAHAGTAPVWTGADAGWFGGARGTQELAKNTFDAFNNGRLFAAPVAAQP